MRVAAVSDLHGNLPEIPPCDLLVIAGDVYAHGRRELERQRPWADGVLRPWLEQLPAQAIVAIAGNRDFLAERDPGFVRSLPWTYLEHEPVELAGLAIFGSPWIPEHGNGVFMDAPAAHETRFDDVPEGIDLLVCHTPPLGTCDRTLAGVDAGSEPLARCLDRITPRLCLVGHIHEAHGSAMRGGTCCANVAVVDRWFARAYGATVLDVSRDGVEIVPARVDPGPVLDPPFL